MRHLKIFITFILAVAAVSACRDNSLSPVPFNTITTNFGGYIRETSIPSGTFNYYDLANSSFQMNISVYDAKGGKGFESVSFFVIFQDGSPSNGVPVAYTPVEKLVHTFAASDFTVDATTGLPSTSINFTAPDMFTLLGLSQSDIGPSDSFNFRQELVLTNGITYSVSNTGADVLAGPFYGSPFFNQVFVVCPSSIPSGAYTATANTVDDENWFGGDATRQVTINKVAGTDNQYLVSDIDGGGYALCCGSFGYNADQPAVVSDICLAIKVTGASTSQINSGQGVGQPLGNWDGTTNTMTVHYDDRFNESYGSGPPSGYDLVTVFVKN